MKYLPLVWAGLWRKRTRTIFTLLSILFAFLLFGMLQGVNQAFVTAMGATNVSRMFTESRISMIEPLPISYAARIAQVPGVQGVSYGVWFGGYQVEPSNFVLSFPVDAETYFPLFPELLISDDMLKTLVNTRNGAIIGVELAKKFNWKVGDNIVMPTAIWTKQDNTSDWPFQIVGIYDHAEDTSKANQFFFNYAYFDEMRAFSRGRVSWFVTRAADPGKIADTAAAIDALFLNSPDETRTQNEKEYAQAYFKQFGDINLIINGIVGAVFFTLLFLTGNTMMQSVRERIPELAVLKTLGFSNGSVVGLVIAESAILCLTAAALGLAACFALFPALRQITTITTLPSNVLLMGAAAALALAVASALPPALQAGRLKIVDALVRR